MRVPASVDAKAAHADDDFAFGHWFQRDEFAMAMERGWPYGSATGDLKEVTIVGFFDLEKESYRIKSGQAWKKSPFL